MSKRIFITLLLILLGGTAWVFSGENKSKKSASLLQDSAALIPGVRAIASKAKETAPDQDAPASLEELQRESARRWTVLSREGTIRLQGGALALEGDDIDARSRAFLRRYAKSVFGVDASSLTETDRSSRMIRYQQTENGMPVWNSKVALFFDEHGSLVHVLADVRAGRDVAAAIGLEEAEKLARSALGKYVELSGGNAADYAAREALSESYLYGEGEERRPMVRFVFPLVRPLMGDYEILIDRRLGQVFSARNLARN